MKSTILCIPNFPTEVWIVSPEKLAFAPHSISTKVADFEKCTRQSSDCHHDKIKKVCEIRNTVQFLRAGHETVDLRRFKPNDFLGERKQENGSAPERKNVGVLSSVTPVSGLILDPNSAASFTNKFSRTALSSDFALFSK